MGFVLNDRVLIVTLIQICLTMVDFDIAVQANEVDCSPVQVQLSKRRLSEQAAWLQWRLRGEHCSQCTVHYIRRRTGLINRSIATQDAGIVMGVTAVLLNKHVL